MEECSDHGESRDWCRHCSDSVERGDRQETVIFGSDHGLLDPNAYLFHGVGHGGLEGRYGADTTGHDEFGTMESPTGDGKFDG